MRLKNVRKIIVEDYPQENQPLVSRLGVILNDFMTQTSNIINGNIDFDNKSEKLVSFDITVDATGKPINNNNTINVGKTNPNGLKVIRAINQTNSSIGVNSCPFIEYTPLENNLIQVTRITGLPSSNLFNLTIIVY